MTPLVAALSSVGTIAAFLVTHYAVIKKEYVMVRTEIADFITSVEKLEAAVVARLSQSTPLAPEEVSALSDAKAKADALAASLSAPAVAP